MSTQDMDDLNEWKRLIWKAVLANKDNPLQERLLDAHFEAILATQRAKDKAAVLEALPKRARQPNHLKGGSICKDWIIGHNICLDQVRQVVEAVYE